MVDLEKLNQRVDTSGLKKNYIADKMGYSASNMTLKFQGKRKITIEDAKQLKKILGLTEKEHKEIFFADM